jgi:hypothetical protein
VVALPSVAQRPRLASSAVVTVLVWAAFATLGVYASGSAAEAVGMDPGLIGDVDQIAVLGVPGAPAVLGSILLAIPELPAAFPLLPAR